ncbi:bifunctional diguanylate cyclase/phosphodiesterase [Fusobacterium varium]|uniref:PAS domain S-box protein n=3 Tax=Fusobacterium varium TaxID=856 RepID=A0ABM6U7M9_FUSVA|nr:EAL domain-containing protein [Fusobacterium varium]AVQ32383.1 PAS domain S-box protein [Fusobacterium varium ATCC 27725]EES64319.1 diguanylate cyclase (GGDEF) domain protein [Fusobacterium varium ATCC 27725]
MNLGKLKSESVYEAFLSLEKILKRDEYTYSEKLRILEEMKRECDISLLGVIILNNRKQIRSDFFWNDSEINNTTIKKFLYNNLLELFERSIKEGKYITLENDEKICKIKNTFLNNFLFLPVKNIQEGFCIGGILVGKKKERGDWKEKEIEIFKTFALVMEMFYTNKYRYDEFFTQSWIFNEILDNMNVNLYVTDIKNDKILYMNKKMKESYNLDEPEGKICWQVLQKGMEKRCNFCPVPKLLEKKDEKSSIVWRENGTITGKIYENYDSLIKWTDGSIVHFQESTDITDTVILKKNVIQDILCDKALNWRAGKVEMAKAIQEAKKNKKNFVVASIDIDDLKIINERYGHIEGDKVIIETIKIIKNSLAEKEFIFRLEGDNFIVVFENRTEKEAIKLLYECIDKLKIKKKELKKEFDFSFCFGTVEIYPGEEIFENDIIARADKKLYFQKLKYHKNKIDSYMDKSSVNIDEKDFIYNKDLLYEALVMSTDDFIYICNMKTGRFKYTPAMVEMFNLPSEIIQNPIFIWKNIVHEDDWEKFYQSNMEIGEGQTDYHLVEFRAKNKDGEYIWLKCRGHLMRDEVGEPSIFAGIMTLLGKQNKIDILTRLLNINEFSKSFEEKIKDYSVETIGMMILGIDDFKQVNEMYDRELGDSVLKMTSQIIQSSLPRNALAYRLDGDQFGILVENTNSQELQNIYNNIKTKLSRQQLLEKSKIFVTISAGCSLYPQDGNKYQELYKYTDYSLQYAKKSGKDKIVFFSNDILEHKSRFLEILRHIRESIENGFEGFEVFYQPQVFCSGTNLKGVEALLRWKCKKFGSISPIEFIPILEESGLIIPVGKWVLREAVKACKEMLEYNKDITVSVNCSFIQLLDENYLDDVKTIIAEEKVPPSNIVLELTESCIIKSIETLHEMYSQMKEIGIKTAMDDFGTGYSSLGILKQVPANIVKIDRAFVKDIINSRFDITFIEFITRICHSVGIKVCLEGIETKEEFDLVSNLEIDYIQGYYFGKPQPKKSIFENYLIEKTEAHRSSL